MIFDYMSNCRTLHHYFLFLSFQGKDHPHHVILHDAPECDVSRLHRVYVFTLLMTLARLDRITPSHPWGENKYKPLLRWSRGLVSLRVVQVQTCTQGERTEFHMHTGI